MEKASKTFKVIQSIEKLQAVEATHVLPWWLGCITSNGTVLWTEVSLIRDNVR